MQVRFFSNFIIVGIRDIIKRKIKMKLLGFLIIVLGLVLKWNTSINSVISWVLIVIGVIIMIMGFLLGKRAR